MAKAKRSAGGFTMGEYMRANRIPGSPQSPTVNRLMREHFARLGLVKVRRSRGWLWVPATDVVTTPDVVGVVEKRLKEIVNGRG